MHHLYAKKIIFWFQRCSQTVIAVSRISRKDVNF